MRKISIFLSILVVAAMLLPACAAEEDRTDVPGTDIPPITDDATATSDILEGTETVSPEDGTTTPDIPVTGAEDASRVSNQLDFDVWNQDGEQIGTVNDMILDLDNTRVAYVIVGTGGFLGIAEKDVLVPWNMLEVQTAGEGGPAGDQNAFVLQADQELFDNAPDVDLNAVLPARGEPAGDWDNEIRSFWESGVVPNTPSPDGTPVPEMTATVSPDGTPVPEGTEIVGTADLQGLLLATEVLGSAVTLSPGQGQAEGVGTGQGQGQATATADPALPTAGPGVGNFTGTIDDIIVDIDTGDILYLVVYVFFDEGERWIPIPLRSFEWDVTNDALAINANPAQVRDAPFFEDDLWPDTTVEGWDDEFEAFWQNLVR